MPLYQVPFGNCQRKPQAVPIQAVNMSVMCDKFHYLHVSVVRLCVSSVGLSSLLLLLRVSARRLAIRRLSVPRCRGSRCCIISHLLLLVLLLLLLPVVRLTVAALARTRRISGGRRAHVGALVVAAARGAVAGAATWGAAVAPAGSRGRCCPTAAGSAG